MGMFESREKFTDLKDIKPRNFVKGTLLVLVSVALLVTTYYYTDPGFRADALGGWPAVGILMGALALIGLLSGLCFPRLRYMLPLLVPFMFSYDAARRGFSVAAEFIMSILCVALFTFLGAAIKKKFFPNF